MIYHLINPEGEVVVSNILDGCKECVSNCNSQGKVINPCPIYNTKRRQGVIKINRGEIFACCEKSKTTKLFRGKLESLSYSFFDIDKIRGEIRNEEQKRVKRLVHNLMSINAHNIQELYDLVSQDLLTSNHQHQIEVIKKELKKDIGKAAFMFLRLAKHNMHMKSEFSIFNKLSHGDHSLNKRLHPIRKVTLNILHTFFIDFNEKTVRVKVKESNKKLNIDYETIQVALYHLIENCAKYTKPNTELLISFEEYPNIFNIVFDMESLFIEDEELERINNEGYSGINAQKIGKNGQGLGMTRIKQMLDLNQGKIIVERGNTPEIFRGIKFARNKFIISWNND